jgi:hypothetical protein
MIRLLAPTLLAATLALAACGTPYEVVPLPDGRYRGVNATEANAYCADKHNGMRARMRGMAQGNVEILFDCVPQ